MKKILIVIFLICPFAHVFSQELLWLDNVKKIKESDVYVHDKKLRRPRQGVIIPSLDFKIHFGTGRQYYYNNELVFDTSSEEVLNKQNYSELFDDAFLVFTIWPSKGSFSQPMMISREKMLIVDYKEKPQFIYEVDLGGLVLIPSTKFFDKSNLNPKFGAITKIDSKAKILTILLTTGQEVKFDLIQRDNTSFDPSKKWKTRKCYKKTAQ
jgi:hypothetical protein